MKKRIISFLLALTLCLGLLPAPVFAEEAPTNQTLAETPVSQNEEPQPEPAPQNEEGQGPQPISQNQEGQEPQQEPAPQNGEAGEPQPEPAPQNGEGQEPQGAPEQMQPQGEPEQGEPQGEPEQGEPQEEPGQGELPVQNVLKANAPMAAAEVGTTLTVGQQEGKLFAGVGGTASFTLSGENVDWTSLTPSFGENASGLSAAVTGGGTTVTVTATGEAKEGTYTLTFGEGMPTADVVVDVPFAVRGEVETVSSDKTSVTIRVNINVTDGFVGNIQYEWLVNGSSTPLKTTDSSSVTLYKEDLTQNEQTPSLYREWICCRVSSGTYCRVVRSASVSINTCDHTNAPTYGTDGNCVQCGESCGADKPFITEKGEAIQIPQNADTSFVLDNYFPGTLYLWEDYTRGTALHVGTLNGDGTLELQKHIVYSNLILDDFQSHSFTIQNGSLHNLILREEAGLLILENVTIEQLSVVPPKTILKLNNVTFKNLVRFCSTASMNGGTFEAGLCNDNGTCLDLLAPGYAFKDSNGTIIDASGDRITGTVQVVSHTCTYKADKAGKCDCGRSCPHESLNEGRCTVCQILVEPFAIGEQGYRSLEEAQNAAQEGQTIYLRGDYKLPNPVVISKNITLDVCGYTLSGSSENALLQITGRNVTVQNGDIWNTQAPAVTVKSGAKLTVKTASFKGGPDHVLVVEQGGHADVQSGAFSKGVLYVNGSLDMEYGIDVKLELGPNAENISIVKGDFDSITLAGVKEYKDLLAEGSAYWADEAWVKLVEAQEKTPVVIAECPHPDGLGENKPCPYCGKTCGHGKIVQETGFCEACGYQVYKAKVDDVMKPTFQKAMEDVQDGQTVTLLADDSLGANLTLDKRITLNMNGKTLKIGTLTVEEELTICGGGEIVGAFSFHLPVTVQGTTLQAPKGVVQDGGSLCIEQDATVTRVSVFQKGFLELKQGTIDTLYVDGGTVRLSSGTVTQNLEVQGGNLLSILAQGKALEKDGKIVDGTKSTVDGPVTVVDHTHTFNENNTCPCGIHCPHPSVTVDGTCKNCGTAFVAEVDDIIYYQDVGTALENAQQTVWLFRDAVLDRTVKVRENTELIVGAFRLSGSGEIQIPGDVRLKSDGNGCIDVPLRLTGGTLILQNAFMGTISSLTVEGGATLESDDVFSGRVEELRISENGGAQLSGGRFGAIRCSDGRTAKNLLPEEHAFRDVDSKTAVVWDTVISQDHPLQNVEVSSCDHTSIDGSNQCAYCGMPCVAECAVSGTTSYYKDLQSALNIQGGTVKLLEDIKNGTFAVNGNGTLDLNGKTLHGSFAPTGSFTIQDSSQTPGKIESLMAGAGTKISGGSFDEIHVQDPETLKSILADNCYYTDEAGTVISVSETGKVLSNVRVAQCNHTSVRKIAGYRPQYTCNCGKVTYLLTVTVGESDTKYFGNYNDGFDYAAKNNGVVRFLDIGWNDTLTVDVHGTVTIDMENRSYSANDRSLVIKSGSTVKLVGQGWQSSAPEPGSGSSGSSGTLEYSVFIPVTVEAGGTFVLPEKNLDGGKNMAKPFRLTVQSGGTAELQGGSADRTSVYGTLKISGGSHSYIHQYEKGQLNITDGQINCLEIHGEIPQNALSGGSYETISVMEFKPGESPKFRDVTFADFQKMLVSGKVFQKKQDQSYPKEAEETPNYGTYNYKKELNNVNVTAAPFTGVEVVCQIGNTEPSGSFTTVYGEREENFFLKARLLSPAAEDQKVGYRWYRVQDGSNKEVGQDETYQLKQPVNVGVYTYQVTASFNGYELTSAPFTVTVGKAPQTADVEAHHETVSGKNDGYVTLNPQISAYEMRKPGEETFTPCEGNGTKLPLPAGTYELRMKETESFKASDIQTVTVRPGPKLTVTMPESTEGYTLTANKTALDWKDTLELTLTLEQKYYRGITFAVTAGDTKLSELQSGVFTLDHVTQDVTITVEGILLDDLAPFMSIENGENQWYTFEDSQPLYTKAPESNQFTFRAVDSGSGLKEMWYCFEKEELDRSQMETLSWNPVEYDSEKGGYTSAVLTREGEYYLYGKALDNVGNVTYVRTGKLIRETQAPTITGPANGSDCYVTRKIKISDNYLVDRIRVSSDDEKPVGKKDTEITLPGNQNKNKTYTVTAWDACGNTSTYTVTMKPMGDLTREADALQPDSIQKADLETLDRVEAALKALDLTDATEAEKITVEEELEYIWALRQVLDGVEAVETRLKALPEQAQPDAETLEDSQILPARKAFDALTAHQKTLVEAVLVRKLETLEAGLKQYAVTQGDGQTWNKGSQTALQFTVAGQMRKWTAAALDGKTLDLDTFTVAGEKDRPMTLTLRQEFLQGLEPGQHTLEVFFGTAATPKVTFTVAVSDTYLDVTGGELAGTETVTVNGVNYPVEQLGNDSYVNLPENGGMLTANSYAQGDESQDADNYPTGMRVYRITREETGAKLERVYELDDLLQYAGCSIRLNGTKGIRMITSVDEKVKNALTGAGLAGFTLEEYGTVIMRGVGTPTLETGSHNYAYKRGVNDPVFATVNGRCQYTNVLVGFSLEDCKQTLTLRPYIILKDQDGVLYTLYGGCVSRSIGYIAKQNENAYKPGTEGYRYIHEIIDAVYGQG